MKRRALSLLLPLLLALASALPAYALDPAVRLADYHHSTWTAKDGAPNEVVAMAQTRDGWLWLASIGGIYRFDGVRFEHISMPSNKDASRRRIRNMVAQPNGDLWLLYVGGNISIRHPDGSMEEYLPEPGRRNFANSISFDSDGSAWVGGTTGLLHFKDGKWTKPAPNSNGLPGGEIMNLLIDQHQQFWVQVADGLYRMDRKSGQFSRIMATQGFASLSESPDGRLWLVNKDQVQLVPQPEGQPAKPRPPEYNQTESRSGGQFDRDGNLWLPDRTLGLMLIRGAVSKFTGQTGDINPTAAATDRFDQAWQMSSRVVNGVLEDREGNIWIATQGGLERLRENRLLPSHLELSHGLSSIAHDSEGQIWVVDALSATTWRFTGRDDPVADSRQPFRAAANDRDGALLLGGSLTIERRHQGQVTQIPLPPGPDGKPMPQRVLGMLDDGRRLWMSSIEQGMWAFENGTWTPRTRFQLPPQIVLGAAAGKGQMWLANADNTVSFFDNDKLSNYPGAGIGFPSLVHVSSEVLVGGDRGLSVLQNGAFRLLHTPDAEVLTNVSGISVTADGDRWLNGNRGVVHVRAADWRDAIEHPARPLRYQLLDVLEGYSGRAMLENRIHSSYIAPDGELWFLTTTGVLRMDRSRQRHNKVPPHVFITGVETDQSQYEPKAQLLLPPASQNFSIHFTAPSLTKPEALRFQYQLAGADPDWQDAGNRRTAFYTNVAPGRYVFRVRAFNEDGVASDNVAEMMLTIEPTIPQTLWFKALCLLAAGAALYLTYRYRLRVVTGRVARELHIRMAERERIARTLHDSFLQSVQALTLRLGTVVDNLPADSPARQQLTPVLDHADATISEGRDQVHELRSGRVDDVESAVRDAAQQLSEAQPQIAFEVMLDGLRRSLQPLAAEELCEMSREALRNAFTHAQAQRIEVRLSYGREHFTLQVSDDGQGMDLPAVQAAQPQRHWGLIGLHERARRIGARLEIGSHPGGGTRISISTPARLAYLRPARRWLFRR